MIWREEESSSLLVVQSRTYKNTAKQSWSCLGQRTGLDDCSVFLQLYLSDAVQIFTGKKLSVQRGKKTLGPGVKGVGKNYNEEKEGSKAKLTAHCSPFLSGKSKCHIFFPYVNMRIY